ncbi:MAG: DUF167 domain-containing protein [Candidatus Undinarchaeales archaeon]|jgi:uncharacterized protein YggU (UPF0235/DUF167 family)|nr:DUF167 domain-containing protein [Candidatus Undinarchaeales archaeon]
MKVTVIAKTNATRQKIQVLGDHKLKVWVNSKPINGKANTEITQFLKKTIKKHIGTIPKIDIITGKTSTTKIVEINCLWSQVKTAISAVTHD